MKKFKKKLNLPDFKSEAVLYHYFKNGFNNEGYHLSKINELEEMIKKGSEIGRRSHFQVKGRLSQLEKKLQKLEHTLLELQKDQSTLNRLLKDFYTEFPGYKAS